MGPTGLPNDGLSCYAITVFQTLASLPEFVDFLRYASEPHRSNGSTCTNGLNKGPCRLCLFHKMMAEYWGDSSEYHVDTYQVLTRIILDNWQVDNKGGQQDPTEYWPELYRQLMEDTPNAL